jgi:hypothetical protein
VNQAVDVIVGVVVIAAASGGTSMAATEIAWTLTHGDGNV